MFCPNKNDKEYKDLSRVVGSTKAHEIYEMNNGNPVSLNADGTPSLIYQQLEQIHGLDKALEMRSKMFSKELNNSNTPIPLKGAEELYNRFKLLNENGRIKQVKSREAAVKYAQSFYKDGNVPEYDLKARQVPNGMWQVFLFPKATMLFSDELISNDTVVTLEGKKIRLNNKVNPTTEIVRHQKRKEYRQTEVMVDDLFRSMEKAVPGLIIHRETFESAGKKFGNARGWVSQDGVHFNMQSLHYDTPIHEITHPWVAAIKMYDADKYNMLISKAQASIEADSTLFNLIQAKYPELDQDDLMQEYLSTVSGLVSVEKVQEFFTRNGVVNTEAKSVAQKIKDIISEVFNAIKKVFADKYEGSAINSIDFEKASLNDIFNALTDDVLNGRKIFNYTGFEFQTLLDNMWDNDKKSLSKDMEANQRPIANVTDIIPYIINNHDVSIVGPNQFDRNSKYADHIVNELYNRIDTNKAGNKKYMYDYGVRYEFPMTMSEDEIKSEIRNKALAHRQQMISSFNGNITQVIESYLSDTSVPLSEVIAEQFKDDIKHSTTLANIESALELIGIYEPIQRVINYKDLRNDPSLSYLYNDSLAGNNPLVIIHSRNDKSIDISVFDLATGILNRADNNDTSNDRNIASAFGVRDSEKKFTHTNNKSDGFKIAIGMQVAGMHKLAKDNGVKLKVRRGGLIGFTGGRIQPNIISDFDTTLKEGRKLFQLDEVQELLDKNSDSMPFLASLLNDDAVWKGDILQSWDERLKSFYIYNKTDLGLSDAQIEHLMENPFSLTHIKLIEQRKAEVQKYMSKEQMYKDPESQMLSQYLIWLKTGQSINNASIKDIHFSAKRMVNMHNQSNIAIQHFSIEAEKTKSIMINKVNGYKEEFVKKLEASMKSHNKSLGAINSNPANMFGHLYVKGKVKLNKDHAQHKAGDVVDVVLFNQLHGSHNLDAARKAGLTQADIDLCDFVLNHIREQMIQLEMHESKKGKKPLSYDEAKVNIDQLYSVGTIPVLSATRNEKIRKGDFLGALRQITDKVAKGEYMSGDELFNDRDSESLSSMFLGKLDYQTQLKQMGIRANQTAKDAGDNTVFDALNIDRFENHTMNLEYLFNMVSLDTARKIEIENRLIPVWNDVQTWMHIVENQILGPNSQKNVRDMLQEYFDLIVLRKNADPKDDRFAPIVRNVLRGSSFISLGYRPVLWVKSAFFNEQAALIDSLATSATNILKKSGEELGYPTAGDMTAAHAKCFTDFHKVYALGKKLGIINQSEVDVIESIFTNVSDKTLWRNQLAQLGNYYTDIFSRLTTMTGFMIHDGSYDAHEYDEETNSLKYDVTKDKRYYENGKFKSSDAEVIFNYNLDLQVDQGTAIDKDNMQIGYDYEEVNTRIKWYSDKFIIGSMDEYQRALMGNQYLGALFTQYRTFMFDKVFNWVGSERDSLYGGSRVTQLDDEGRVRVVRELIKNEGIGASLFYLTHDLIKLMRYKDYTIDDFKNMSDARKRNLMLLINKAALLGLIYMGVQALDLGDDDERKITWLYSELMPFDMYTQTYDSLVPMISQMNSVGKIMFGSARWSRALRYTGPAYDALWSFELLSSEDKFIDELAAPSEEERKALALEKRAERIEDKIQQQEEEE